jgi:hypothetical protein
LDVLENAAATMTAARSATLRILIIPSLKPPDSPVSGNDAQKGHVWK